jgi:hypothetical protein
MAPQQAKAGKAEISGTERADVPPGTYARGPGEARADGRYAPFMRSRLRISYSCTRAYA